MSTITTATNLKRFQISQSEKIAEKARKKEEKATERAGNKIIHDLEKIAEEGGSWKTMKASRISFEIRNYLEGKGYIIEYKGDPYNKDSFVTVSLPDTPV